MTNQTKEKLIAQLKDKSAVVAVIGLGYVGLPLVVVFGNAGYKVIGIDTDKRKVDQLNHGISYIQDVPTSDVKRLHDAGLLSATTDFTVLKDVQAVSICVPTPLKKTGDPDLSFIVNATDELAKYVHKGMVVTLESTTYPGTTRELILPRLSECCNLITGEDLFLAFSPERVDPGRKDWTTYNTPKVVGGITLDCSEVAAYWYQQALKTVIQVSSAEVAEMTKLLENTFRMINIGLVNELAMICNRLGVDVWEVVEAAGTKPFGFMKFTPGPGLGGHCIPIDPLYLSWKMKSLNYNARFIELASEINTNMPRFVVTRIQDALNDRSKPLKGSKILVLGASYKPDIDDLRESPALDVMGLLMAKGAHVDYHDPFIPALRHDTWKKKSVSNLETAVKEVDCVVIITNHTQYDYAMILKNASLIVDTRNALGKVGSDNRKVVRL